MPKCRGGKFYEREEVERRTSVVRERTNRCHHQMTLGVEEFASICAILLCVELLPPRRNLDRSMVPKRTIQWAVPYSGG
eukprot:scaffold3181_cov167-Amphora_coffeaeformis.AAC.7